MKILACGPLWTIICSTWRGRRRRTRLRTTRQSRPNGRSDCCSPRPQFYVLTLLLLKTWCASNWPPIPEDWADRKLSWPPGQQLPGDLVDEGKLLLFMKEEVVSRAPKKGARVAKQRKRKAAAAGVGVIENVAAAKRRQLASGTYRVSPLLAGLFLSC